MSQSNATNEFERADSKTPKQVDQGEGGEPVADKPVGEGEEGAEPKEGEQIPVVITPATEEQKAGTPPTMEQQVIEMQKAVQKIKNDFAQFKADEFVNFKEEYEEKSESYDE